MVLMTLILDSSRRSPNVKTSGSLDAAGWEAAGVPGATAAAAFEADTAGLAGAFSVDCSLAAKGADAVFSWVSITGFDGSFFTFGCSTVTLTGSTEGAGVVSFEGA